MGIYFKVACDRLQQSIDPGFADVEQDPIYYYSIKEGICHPDHPFGSIVLFCLMYKWRGEQVRLVSDIGDDPGYYTYEDITQEVLDSYNDKFKTNLLV